ncbi:MAG: tyrosine-type recombinase/integrase [Leptospiraceae bacterium]|nr:tyrosine-type recombinase/integrase [Leptospiraceae bacterium]
MKSNNPKPYKPSKSMLNLLKTRNLNESTNSSYLHYYGEFLKFINKSPKDIDSTDIQAYLNHLRKNKCAYSTFNINLNALKVFHEKLFSDPLLQNIKRPKIKNLNLDVLSHEEIIHIIEHIDNIKHKAIFAIIYYCGLKSSEVVRLKFNHIDFKKKKIKIPPVSESKKIRLIDMNDDIFPILQEYVKAYGKKEWLFPGKPSTKPYSVRSLQRLFTETGIRFGIEKILTPITVRRSRAIELQKKGFDWTFIKDFLGHEGKDTTRRFYRELSRTSE